MSKQDFLDELALLLSDIPAEEKDEALDFYNNYFEDAGPENEDQVLSELGSAKQVAASIKRELIDTQVIPANAAKQNQESTTGNTYRDPFSRSRKPDYSSYQSGGKSSRSTENHYDSNGQNSGYSENYTQKQRTDKKTSIFSELRERLESWTFYRENRTLCIVIFLVILLASSPVWGGALAGIIGLFFGMLGLLFGIIATSVSLACAGYVLGIILLIAGFSTLAPSLGLALFLIGAGILSLAFALLFTIAVLAICGRFIPWCIKSIIRAIRGTNYKAGGAAA